MGLTPSSGLLVGSDKVCGNKGEVKVLIAGAWWQVRHVLDLNTN